MKNVERYVITLLTLTIIAFLLFGLDFLFNLIFKSSMALSFISSLGTALALLGLEFGGRPTKYGKKSDFKVLLFSTIAVIIAIIIIGTFFEKIEFTKLILMCALLSLLAFAAYFAMPFYDKWNSARKARKLLNKK
jgi:ammonia channel protein AmtB